MLRARRPAESRRLTDTPIQWPPVRTGRFATPTPDGPPPPTNGTTGPNRRSQWQTRPADGASPAGEAGTAQAAPHETHAPNGPPPLLAAGPGRAPPTSSGSTRGDAARHARSDGTRRAERNAAGKGAGPRTHRSRERRGHVPSWRHDRAEAFPLRTTTHNRLDQLQQTPGGPADRRRGGGRSPPTPTSTRPCQRHSLHERDAPPASPEGPPRAQPETGEGSLHLQDILTLTSAQRHRKHKPRPTRPGSH